MIALIVLLILLLFIIIVFNPQFDVIPLFSNEKWYILWYNKYSFHNWRISVERAWTPILCIEK